MIFEKLEVYTKRKELSQKAKNEIYVIINSVNFDNPNEVEGLVNALMQLHIDITYYYITNYYCKFTEQNKINFINSIKKLMNANKIIYLYIVCAALQKCDQKDSALLLLEEGLSICLFDKKTNKKFFADLERVIKYDGSNVLFSKFDNWEKRNINSYRCFLTEFYEYTINDEYSSFIVSWFTANEIPIPKIITEKANDKSIQEELKKYNTKTIEDYSSEMLLTALQKKLSADAVAFEKTLVENTDLKKGNGTLRTEILELKKSLLVLEEKNKIQNEENKRNVNALTKKQEELSILHNEYLHVKTENDILSKRLSNVESAYDQAGSQEIAELKLKIKNRLSTTYSKYIEIKGKTADIDYYDILILALDEIFKTLKKNGILF